MIILSFSAHLLAGAGESSVGKQPNEIVKMDRIIAIVDQGVITEQELIERTRTVKAQLEKQGTQLPPDKVLEKQVLERLIADSLQL
ncbi:MAG TPA: molecular chaperone SurA, partial [Methylotenera sp.]|nr:molecular chaperone SurA [Methylotenera sp.]